MFHRRGRLLHFCSILVLLLSCASAAMAQAKKTVLPEPPLPSPPLVNGVVQPVSPFSILGFLQNATLDSPDDPLSGGIMIVNGYTITVTPSTTVNLPGTLLRWSDLFSLAPKPWGPTQTGLALTDRPKPLATYEVLVQGNRTVSGGKDQYIAGLIFLSQQSLNAGQGFINFIDYATGEMRVGGTINDRTTGARVRLNDPLGRYGLPGSPDVRFAVDENNPTVRSASGYPMCIPRVNLALATPDNPIADDPLCPQLNRPKDPSSGAFLSFITMPPPPCSYFAPLSSGAPSVVPPDCTLAPAPGTPDATRQMPFEVGDYITFRGTLISDTTSPGCVPAAAAAPLNPACQYVSAWSMIANLGAFTAPGTMPAYVAIDVTLMGTGAFPTRGLGQEATAMARVEGFTTDPTEPVDIYGVDVDPCSGATTDRYWGTQPVQQIGTFGRFRFIPVGGTFIPPVREVRAVSQTLSRGAIPATIVSANTFANGIIAGQYDAPLSVFVFPESAEVGARLPLNLQDFPFLLQDVGGGIELELPGQTVTGHGCMASLTPSALSFPDQAIGVISAPQNVTLTNTGAGAVNIGKISITPNFSQTNDCATLLPVGASCTLSVTFQPNSSDVQKGVLQVSDTAAGSPQTVSLLGTAGLTRIASVLPTALSFSDQTLGTPSAPQKVTLKNIGTGAFDISNVSISPGYTQTNDCGTSLAAGATCTFTVAFQPTLPGRTAGELQISDTATGSPQTVSLVGTVAVTRVASLTPTALSFSDQLLGTRSSPQTVTLKNTGNAAFDIVNVSISPTYAQTNNCGTQLAPGASCTFTVTFLPTSPAPSSGSLQVSDSATGGVQTVSLLGTAGFSRSASLVPSALSFSDQLLGSASAPRKVTLKNTGTAAFDISNVVISPSYSQTNNCGNRLAPGASCTFIVTFLPTSPGAKSGALQVSDNATGSPQTVALIGTVAVVPAASWSQARLSFPDQAPGTASAPQTVTLSNPGSAGLNIKSLFVSPGYSQNNDCPRSLQPGAKCTFTVKFSPHNSGGQPGTLRITDNAAGSPHGVSLAGTSSDFQLTPGAGSAMSATVFAGQTATYQLRVAGTPSASGTVKLSCSGLPAGATCKWSSPAVTLHGTQSQPVTVWISTPTPAGSTTAQRRNGPMNFPLGISLFGGLVATVFTRKRPQKYALGVIAACALMLSGCGGGPWTHDGSISPRGQYQITITATASNGAVHTMRLGLTINPRLTPTKPEPTRPTNQPAF